MTDSAAPAEKTNNDFSLAPLVVAALCGVLVAGVAVYFYNTKTKTEDKSIPVAVVDMVKLSASIAKLTAQGGDGKAAMDKAAETFKRLKGAGYLILDARLVIGAPDKYVMQPWDLVPEAPKLDFDLGYTPPAMQTVEPAKRESAQ